MLSQVPPIFDALASELKEMGIDTEQLYHDLGKEAAWRLDKSIQAGERVAAGKAKASNPEEAAVIGA